MRGLKYKSHACQSRLRSSHPAWGAWIEISNTYRPDLKEGRRTPHGVRGLKYPPPLVLRPRASRTPHGVRGLKCQASCRHKQRERRTPHGVRGLK